MSEKLIETAIKDLGSTLAALDGQKKELLRTAQALVGCLTNGGTVYICGNGGSAAEAQHFSAEFVGRFLMERPPLSSVALTCDTSKLTAIGNDYGFDEVFARQIKALGRPGDFLWAMSTSGTSPNVLKALKVAREAELGTLFMCGPNSPGEVADHILTVPTSITPRIQEIHLFYGHTLCHLVDIIIFGGPEGKVGVSDQ